MVSGGKKKKKAVRQSWIEGARQLGLPGNRQHDL